MVDDNSKINKELCSITRCNTTSKEDYWKKRKFIICQYQNTIQLNLRYPICYDDHDIICSLKKQGKKLHGKFKILIGYACVSGSYRCYRRACWSYTEKS